MPLTRLERVPEPLRADVERAWSDWCEKGGEPQVLEKAPQVRESLASVWAMSPFVARSCILRPSLLAELIEAGDLLGGYASGEMRQRLQQRLQDVEDEAGLMTRLRDFRRREMVRIAWRDLAGWSSTAEVLEDLSELADVCVSEALTRLQAWLEERHGQPRTAEGRVQGLVVLGMGKLGGRELNYSSDIDLIFFFESEGETDGRKPIACSQFFQRLGQRLIRVIDEVTADGFVFRVDMRLRPNGDSGPLVMNLDAAEAYYATQGREWERYAMIKARVIAGDFEAGRYFSDMLRPFVFRRYLDYGALKAIRDMKAMIERELARKGMQGNVKLGPGGIREIEFIGQAFQLIRGGRERELQIRPILPVLQLLAERDYLPPYAVEELAEAYDFLRRTENRLQMVNDRQTHRLPEEDVERQRLAFAMGCPDWPDFRAALDAHMRRVHSHFQKVFAAPQAEEGGEKVAEDPLAAVWLNTVSDEEGGARLQQAGFADVAEVQNQLAQVRDGHAYRAMTSTGRERLDTVMPLLLSAAGAMDEPESVLRHLVNLVLSISRRTVYLALLVENPMVLSQLVRLCAASPWIADLLARQPVLLDELLDPRSLYHPPSPEELDEELERLLQRIDPDDQEALLDALRHFRQANVLRVAAADISGGLKLMRVSDHLTWIAESLLRHSLAQVQQAMWHKHGRPHYRLDDKDHEASMAVIAYGKLGGYELGYGSDLDIVFLHDSQGEAQMTDGERSLDNATFFARMGQRMIHFLTVRTAAGVLYEVDTRLRPDGASGLLVSSLTAFEKYQKEDAWTWEHQALVRARMVAGNEHLRQEFERIRREVLGRPRDIEALRQDVLQMRNKMRQSLDAPPSGMWHLKHGRGGLTDIEFMVQFSVLAHAHAHPKLLAWTDNIRLLETLAAEGLLAEDDADRLINAYRDLRNRTHRLALLGRPVAVPEEEFAEYRQHVRKVWQALMQESGEAAS